MIRIEIDDTELRQALAQLQEAVGDLSPVMRQIGELLVERTRQRFREGKAPDGSAWAPNTPSTLEAFMRRYYGGAVPRRKRDGAPTARAARTQAGKRPLIGESRRLSAEISYAADRDSVAVGSSLAYAAVQQFGRKRGESGTTRRGAPIPWGDIPARPLLGLAEDDRRDVLAILAEHLDVAES